MKLIEDNKKKQHFNLFKKDISPEYLNEFYISKEDGFNAVIKHTNPEFFSPLMTIRIINVLEIVKELNPKNILDAGCGGAITTKTLAKNGFDITGIDLDHHLDKIPREGLKFNLMRGDVTSIPMKDNSFELVICTDVLEHILDRNKAIRELSRVSKDKVIITVPNLYSLDSIEGKTGIITKTIKLINYFRKKPILKYGYSSHIHKCFPSEWKKVIESNNLKVIHSRPYLINIWLPRVITPFKLIQNYLYRKPLIVKLQLMIDKIGLPIGQGHIFVCDKKRMEVK